MENAQGCLEGKIEALNPQPSTLNPQPQELRPLPDKAFVGFGLVIADDKRNLSRQLAGLLPARAARAQLNTEMRGVGLGIGGMQSSRPTFSS